MNRSRRVPLFGLAVLVLLLAADQLSKFVVIDFMARRAFVPLDITDHFSLVMVWNRGVSFGMLSAGDDAVRWGLTVFALAVAAGLVVWMSRLADRLQTFAAGLVAGGAIGNAIDRVVHGAVADFLNFHVGNWSWPAFNVADSAITTGVAILVVHALLSRRSGRRMKP